MTISEKEVDHIAHLARLEISKEERELFTRQLGEILKYAEKINEVDTKDIPPFTCVIPLETSFREDIPRALNEEERKMILENAPEKTDNFFIVPQILDE